jgi:hypothetical protein
MASITQWPTTVRLLSSRPDYQGPSLTLSTWKTYFEAFVIHFGTYLDFASFDRMSRLLRSARSPKVEI